MNTNRFLNVLNDVLGEHGIKWCRGECGECGHKRGFVLRKDRTTIHFDSKICTRSSLHNALHEVGHCINDEKGLRSFECEAGAEKFANDTMKEYGVSVPRKSKVLGFAYIKRKKKHGDRIKRGRGL